MVRATFLLSLLVIVSHLLEFRYFPGLCIVSIFCALQLCDVLSIAVVYKWLRVTSYLIYNHLHHMIHFKLLHHTAS